MHSWRALILPYLDDAALRDAYDFNEPWDGPKNRLLANDPELAQVYKCIYDDESPLETSYVVIVGTGTAWPGATSVSLDQIVDLAANTIHVVETTNSGINWLEPRDLPFAPQDNAETSLSAFGIASKHTGGANVLTCDCAVYFIREDLPLDKLRALLTIDSREVIDDDWH